MNIDTTKSLPDKGMGSGLPIKEIVEKLVAAKIAPAQVQQKKRVDGVNVEIQAVSQLKGSLEALRSSLSDLSNSSKLYSLKFSLSDSNYFTPTLSATAVKGTYQIQVDALAQKHTLATGYFPNNTATVGSGQMTIKFGTYNSNKTTFTENTSAPQANIVIPSGATSLAAVCEAINKSSSGVTANIIQDAQGSRLSLTSSQSGESYAMQISGDLTALNYDPTTGVNTLTQTSAAQNSLIQINGLTISQSSNQLNNVMSGLNINLTKAEPGKTISLTVDDNKDQLTTTINDYVKKYNDTMTLLTNLTGYNKEEKKGGVYQGDPQFRNLKIAINKMATDQVGNANGSIRSLADLGIKTNKQGLLDINKDQFNKALTDHYSEIGGIFTKSATVSDGSIRVNSVDKRAVAGTYDINLTEYTAGVSMSGTIGSYAATSGDGVHLNGSGNLASVSLEVLGGTAGARGKITITDGLASKLDNLIKEYIDGDKGDLIQRSQQLTKSQTELTKSQARIDARSIVLTQKYGNQYLALDKALGKMTDMAVTVDKLLAQLK